MKWIYEERKGILAIPWLMTLVALIEIPIIWLIIVDEGESLAFGIVVYISAVPTVWVFMHYGLGGFEK